MPNPNIQPLGGAEHIHMAIVAKSGWGKTVFAGTAPNALFITTDPEGTASAKAFGSTAKEWKVKDQHGLQEAYRYLDQGGIQEDGWDWVIIDNLTECQMIFRDASIAAGVERKPDRNPWKPELQDYLVAQLATIDLVKKFNTLPVNMIYTIHIKGREDSDGNDYYSAAIQGSDGEVAETILGYMNIIGMGSVLEIEGRRVRRLYFDFVREFRGKDRFDALGPYQDNLTVPDLVDYVFGEEKKPVAQPSRPQRRPQRRA